MWTWVRRALLLVAALVVLAVVVKAVQLATLGWRTGREATTALAESREEAAGTLAELSTLVERDLGVPVTHAATGYTCRVDHADQGWFVAYYYQECTWLQTAYVEVDDAQLARIVDELGGVTSAGQDCPRLYPAFEDGADRRFRYTPVYVHPAGAEGGSCDLPVLEPGPSGGDTRPAETVVLQEVPPTRLDPSKNWVSVEASQQFFRKDLGCGFGIIFCNQPMSRPALPPTG